MKSLKNILTDIANSELKGDPFAWAVAKYYDLLDKSNKEKFYDSYSAYYSKHSNDTELPFLQLIPEEKVEIVERKDFRIKWITFSNVRGIPGKINNIPFGIDFSKNEIPMNAIVLGPNASGKSSIFSGLEYIYAMRIGEADLRTKNLFKDGDEYFKEYLKHFNNMPECSVSTNSGVYDLHKNIFPKDNLRHRINPNNHFISDFDLYENGKINFGGKPNDEQSFHYLIASSLGLQEFLDFQNLIFNLSNYRRLKESTQLGKLQKEKRENEVNIKNWNTEITKRVEEIKLIEEDKEGSSNNVLQKRIEEGLLLSQKLIQENVSINISLKEFESDKNEFVKLFDEFRILPEEKLSEIETEFFSLGLEILEHSSIQECPFCGKSAKDIDAIKKEIFAKLELHKTLVDRLNRIKFLYKNICQFIQDLTNLSNSLRDKLDIELSSLKERSEFLLLFKKQSTIHQHILDFDFFLETKEFLFNTPYSKQNSELLAQILVKLNLAELDQYLQEIGSFSTFRKQEILNIVDQLKSKQTISSIKEKIAVLKSEILKFQDQLKQAQNRIDSLNKDLPPIELATKMVIEIKEKAQIYNKFITDRINEVVNSSFEPISNTICEILEEYIDDESIKLEIYKDIQHTEDGEILSETLKARLIKVSGDEKNIPISPSTYFNTFRYRLFCLMVSCSIALATRRNTGINIPLVIDDLFYASDYKNRSTIVVFLKKLLSIYCQYSPKEMDPQLILFTHDEMIFDCAVEAIEDIENEIQFFKIHPRDSTKYLRLFPATDKDEIPQIKGDLKYWNLVYEIPSEVPNFYDLIK